MSQDQEQYLKNFIYNNCDRRGTFIITGDWQILMHPPRNIMSIRKKSWSSILKTKYILDNLKRMYWVCTVVSFKKKWHDVVIKQIYTLT